jgi:hypothetical protein
MSQMRQMLQAEREQTAAMFTTITSRLAEGGRLLPMEEGEPTRTVAAAAGSRLGNDGHWEWLHQSGECFAIPETFKYPLPMWDGTLDLAVVPWARAAGGRRRKDQSGCVAEAERPATINQEDCND